MNAEERKGIDLIENKIDYLFGNGTTIRNYKRLKITKLVTSSEDFVRKEIARRIFKRLRRQKHFRRIVGTSPFRDRSFGVFNVTHLALYSFNETIE